jgi:hypothetical protein
MATRQANKVFFQLKFMQKPSIFNLAAVVTHPLCKQDKWVGSTTHHLFSAKET